MQKQEKTGISRRLLFKLSAAGAAAATAFGRGSAALQAHDLKPTDRIYKYEQYEAIVNRRDASVRQVYQWPNLKNPIIFGNIRNGINGFQFSYGIPASAVQVVVQAYASANGAMYDDFIWEKYKLGEMLDIIDPKTEKAATRNIWYASSVDAEEVETAPDERDHPYYADTSIQGLQRRGVLFLI